MCDLGSGAEPTLVAASTAFHTERERRYGDGTVSAQAIYRLLVIDGSVLAGLWVYLRDCLRFIGMF